MFKGLTQCVFLFLLLFGSVFYAVKSFAEAPLTSPQILRVQFSSEPSQYDPLMMEDGVALRLAANIFGTLMEYDSQGKLQTALLESFQKNKTSTEFIIKFKPNLKWSDGIPFHPKHFLLALERLSSAKVKVALSALFPKVDFQKTEIKSDREIKVVLEKSDPLFLQWCSLPPFAPIREDIISIYEKKPSSIIPTLGPFKLAEIKRDEWIKLAKNLNYYDEKKIRLDEVQILIIKDEQSYLPLLQAKKIDLITRVPILQIESIKKIAHVHTFPVGATTYLGLNVRLPPFDQHHHRAQLQAVLRRQLEKLARTLKTDELPARQFIPLVLQEGVHLPVQKTELTKTPQAKILLQTDSGSRNQTIMEFIQYVIKENELGVASIDSLDWREHLARLKSGTSKASAFRLGWQNPVSDPFVFYQVFASDSANNFTGWSSKKYDEFLAQLKISGSEAEKKALVIKLEEILLKEAPVVPLLHQVLKFASSKRVQGFRANPFGVIHFREIRLDSQINKTAL